MWSWKFLPTPGQVVHDRDPERAQLVGRADPGQEQEPRRVDGAAGEDDLAAGLDPGLARLAVVEVPDADGPTVLDDQPASPGRASR